MLHQVFVRLALSFLLCGSSVPSAQPDPYVVIALITPVAVRADPFPNNSTVEVFIQATSSTTDTVTMTVDLDPEFDLVSVSDYYAPRCNLPARTCVFVIAAGHYVYTRFTIQTVNHDSGIRNTQSLWSVVSDKGATAHALMSICVTVPFHIFLPTIT